MYWLMIKRPVRESRLFKSLVVCLTRSAEDPKLGGGALSDHDEDEGGKVGVVLTSSAYSL